MAPRPANPTGFDIKKFAAASGTPANDPWARLEAWRYTGIFTARNRFRNMFPGFGIATVAFAAYCGYEYLTSDGGHKHSDGGHDEKH